MALCFLIEHDFIAIAEYLFDKKPVIFMMTYQQWQLFAETILAQNTKDPFLNPKTDVKLLLQFVTQKSKAQIIAYPEIELDEKTQQKLTALLARRAKGEPMAYILGEAAFWSLNLEVSQDTLIPRPDTEVLVEQAIEAGKQCLHSTYFRQHGKQELHILDLGTGTGAIALALASALQAECDKQHVKLAVVGVDRIAGAVELAKRNGLRNHLPQVEFLHSDWFSALEGRKFDLIVSNPPYIDETDEHLRQGDVRFEPLSALVAEEQGYADLRFLIENAPHFLQPQGYLLLEHGWQQGEKVRSIFAENLWTDIATVKDYGDNERVSSAQWGAYEI